MDNQNTIFWLVVFMLCMNTAVYAVAETLGIEQLQTYEIISKEKMESYEAKALTDLNQTGGFHAPLIFGDWITGINMFWKSIEFGTDFVDGGHIIRMASIFGVPETFTLPLKVLIGFFIVGWLIYMVTGRK
jgi:hypothetical protein